MMDTKQKRAVIFAGPNGAGKTTFAMEFLPSFLNIHNFINADMIAQGLNPLNTDSVQLGAAKLLLKRIEESLQAELDFAVETTLSGKTYQKQVPKWRELGYYTELHYIQLSSVEESKRRVDFRVLTGGHKIPEKDIYRRFDRSRKNFQTLKLLVNEWSLYKSDSGVFVKLDEGYNHDY